MSDDVKYFGYFISSDGKDDKDMTRAYRHLYVQGNSLIRKFHMCTENVKVKLFTTYCSQLYCAHLWKFNVLDNFYKKVNVAYNNVFRSFLRLPRDDQGRPCSASHMFASRNIKSLQEILRNVVYKFQCRLNVSNNSLVKCTLFRIVKEKSKLRNHWSRLLLPDRLVAD